MSKKIWQEVVGERTFLIPEGLPLEAGSLEIENGSGDRMMVSEESILPYIATEDEIEEHQDQTVEETIAELGKAFSSLFQAGKEMFSQALQTSDSSEEESEEESEVESENVVDVDFERQEESSEGFFNEITGIFQESKVEFQSIFQEAKQEFKKSLRDKETADLLRSIGSQIVDFANSLQNDSSEDTDESDSSPTREAMSDEGKEVSEPPPVAHSEEPKLPESDDDSNDIPPSPLSDDNE